MVINGDDPKIAPVLDKLGVTAFPSIFYVEPNTGEVKRLLTESHEESLRMYIWSKLKF